MSDKTDHIDADREPVGDMLEAYKAWLKQRGPLGVGAMPERIFFAGWLAARRTPSASIGEDGLPAITDAEIAGIMGWRGPGAYTEASLRKIRRVVEQAVAADRRARAGAKSDAETAETRMDTGSRASAMPGTGSASPQAAQGVKTWRERMYTPNADGMLPEDEEEAMQAEIADLRAQLERQSQGLQTIALWELPPTSKFWGDGKPVSYEVEYGSNGAREFMRQVAFNALAAPPLSSEQQAEKGQTNVG